VEETRLKMFRSKVFRRIFMLTRKKAMRNIHTVEVNKHEWNRKFGQTGCR
jgi:hypothetical protein